MFRYLLILLSCLSVFFCCYAVYTRIPIEFCIEDKIVLCLNGLEPPFSLPVFLPGLLLEILGYSWIFVPLNYSVLFLVLIFPILQKRNLSEESSIPKHILVFAKLVFIFSALYFITFWKVGVANRGGSFMNHVFFFYVFGWVLIFFNLHLQPKAEDLNFQLPFSSPVFCLVLVESVSVVLGKYVVSN